MPAKARDGTPTVYGSDDDETQYGQTALQPARPRRYPVSLGRRTLRRDRLTHPERLPRIRAHWSSSVLAEPPLHASPSQPVDTETCAGAQEGAFCALRRPSSHR